MDAAYIQLVSLAVALLALSCASYFDLKTRRVPNILWAPPMLVGAATTPLMVERGVIQVEEAALSGASALLLAYLLLRLKILGGADCKAIIVACILVPVGRGRLPLHFLPLALVTNLFIMLGALTLVVATAHSLRRKVRGVVGGGGGAGEGGGADSFSWRRFSPPLMPLITLSLLVSFFIGNLAFAAVP
ncbi:MAG: prepilin peptidase [Candidatus Freyarchaeota archaeon]|nr:prepilin peptidase [Candidatus Jordarchaeia archaeon]